MSNRAKAFLLLIVDLFILTFSLTVVIYARRSGHPSEAYLIKHYIMFSFLFPFWILMYFIEGLYTLKTYNPASLPISLIRGTLISIVLSVILIYLLPTHYEKITPKMNLVLMAGTSLPLLFLWRRFFFQFFSGSRRLRNTFIVGSQETIDLVKFEINQKPHLGYRIFGDGTQIPPGTELIAIERNVTKDTHLYKTVFSMLGSGVEVMDLAKFAEQISGKIPITAINDSWFIEYCGHQESRSYEVIKNITDRSVALILLVCLTPVAAILFPILILFHGRPIFFKQVRTGLNNLPFVIYKLRTMVTDAEKHGAQGSKPGDSRITRLGMILRKTRLDELPQLINILKGEMSLVGPRPERPEMIEKELAPNIPYYNQRHLVKPGVTGWAQVTFRYGFSQEDSKEKLQYDLYYVKNRSGWLDLLVILKTIKTVITGAGQ